MKLQNVCREMILMLFQVTEYLIRRSPQNNDLIEAIMIEKPGEPKKQEDASAKLRFVLFQRFNFSLIISNNIS